MDVAVRMQSPLVPKLEAVPPPVPDPATVGGEGSGVVSPRDVSSPASAGAGVATSSARAAIPPPPPPEVDDDAVAMPPPPPRLPLHLTTAKPQPDGTISLPAKLARASAGQTPLDDVTVPDSPASSGADSTIAGAASMHLSIKLAASGSLSSLFSSTLAPFASGKYLIDPEPAHQTRHSDVYYGVDASQGKRVAIKCMTSARAWSAECEVRRLVGAAHVVPLLEVGRRLRVPCNQPPWYDFGWRVVGV